MRISKEKLVEKLRQLDQRLLDIWLIDDSKMSEEDVWDLFSILLETRVEILKSCRDAGIVIPQVECVPKWLENLVENRQELRLREIRKMAFELQRSKKIDTYDVNSKMFGTSKEIEP